MATLTQEEYAKRIFDKIHKKLQIGETPLSKFEFPEQSPVSYGTMKRLKLGELALSITKINDICENFLEINPPKLTI